MSRPHLSLYRMERSALRAFSETLRDLLIQDDRPALATFLGLAPHQLSAVQNARWVVELFLGTEEDGDVLFSALRRVAKRSALEFVWTSDFPSLEGRLRAYDLLREDNELAALLDRAVSMDALPWFLQRAASAGGWLDDHARSLLAERLDRVAVHLPNEIQAFAEALGGIDGDVVLHDGL